MVRSKRPGRSSASSSSVSRLVAPTTCGAPRTRSGPARDLTHKCRHVHHCRVLSGARRPAQRRKQLRASGAASGERGAAVLSAATQKMPATNAITTLYILPNAGLRAWLRSTGQGSHKPGSEGLEQPRPGQGGARASTRSFCLKPSISYSSCSRPPSRSRVPASPPPRPRALPIASISSARRAGARRGRPRRSAAQTAPPALGRLAQRPWHSTGKHGC